MRCAPLPSTSRSSRGSKGLTDAVNAERYPCACSQLIIQSMPNLSVQDPK